jgi:hypothetical protein
LTHLKGIVLLLALANIGYFLYVRGIAPQPQPPPPPPAGIRLTLVSEAPAMTPALPAEVPRCVSIGPFVDVSEAARAEATLRGGGYAPRQRVAQGDVWAGVWVYLPLPPTPAAANQLRSKLKSGGFDDILDMPGPSDTPVVSLGLFNEPQRAQARVVQAQKLGLSPATLERKRSGDVYWVDVNLKPDDAALNPADFHVEAGRIARLEVKACSAAPSARP